MTVEVRPVHDKKGLESFIRLPWQLYQGDPNWVPPLLTDQRLLHDPVRNPFFEHSQTQNFLAWDSGRIVGRITAIRNTGHNSYWNDSVGFFGMFESERRPEVARALLREAARWLSGRGLTVARGPMNFSTNDDCGLLVDGFDRPPVLMMPYNPAWYPELITGAGLEKVKDLLAFSIEEAQFPERLKETVPKILARKNIRIRPMDMKRFEQDVQLISDIYRGAWEKNWGFVPLTDHEIAHMARSLKPAVDPNLILFAEVDGKPVGLAVALPDLYEALKHCNGRLFPFGLFQFLWHKRNIKMCRVLMLGVIEGYRNMGVDAGLVYELFKRGMARGIHSGEMSWILEDNIAMRRPIENVGGRVYKTYRVYEAPVERLLA